ncbi:MAG: polysaccharide pyruvyl transferase family protein [Phycisphaerales bacterium]
MRIVLLNAHNTLNYGTMMMCENVITHLDAGGQDVDWIVLADEAEETRSRLAGATGSERIEIRPRFASLAGFLPGKARTLVDRGLFRYINLSRTIGRCDAVIVLGGDDLSEYYGRKRVADIFLRILTMNRSGRKVFLLGQTVGPFSGFRRGLARRAMDSVAAIVHRGPKSAAYARDELGCRTEQHVSGDLAFLPLARPSGPEQVEPFGLVPRRYQVLVPSGLGAKYKESGPAYRDGLLTVARHMLAAGAKQAEPDGAGGPRLVILPHVLRHSDDRPLSLELASVLRGEGVDAADIIVPEEPMLPHVARAILGQSRMNVSQRMHGAINSLQQGTPVIALSYSVKYADVIGTYLDLPELVVERREGGFAAMAADTCDAYDRVVADMPAWRERVEASVARARTDAASQLTLVSSRLGVAAGG